MHFLTLVFGIALLSEAYTLKCNVCSGSTLVCNVEVVECPVQGVKCGTVRIRTYIGNAEASKIITKSCLSADQCIEGSVNFGLAKTEIASNCCSTDLCNTGPFNASVTTPSPNGKKCFTCTAPGQCTKTLDCQGTEDHCISSTLKVGAETLTMKGCASEQICSNPTQITGSIGVGMSCCKGNLCNSASGAGVIFPLLLAAVLASIMF